MNVVKEKREVFFFLKSRESKKQRFSIWIARKLPIELSENSLSEKELIKLEKNSFELWPHTLVVNLCSLSYLITFVIK